MTPQEAIKILKPLFEHCKGKNECLGYIEHFFTKDEEEALDMAIQALEQQPCEDCISRKRVIMLIDEATEKYPYKIIGLSDTYSNYNQGWTDACDWLYANIESDNLPSVTPKAEWIPVSERLPEDGRTVLVWYEYFRYGDYNKLFQTYGLSYAYGGHWSEFVNGESGWKDLRIIAWMPLPEPYKAESEDEK